LSPLRRVTNIEQIRIGEHVADQKRF